jgi:hypothetical protein
MTSKNDNVDRGYASPACLLHEVDPAYADPKLDKPELVAALNALIEAERAGAKVVARTIRECSEPGVLTALERIGRDEARYVSMLSRWVKRLGAAPSSATGRFYEQASAIADLKERLAFLNRGQNWVARRLDELMPRVADAALHAELMEMRKTHMANIERANEVVPLA